MKRLITILAVFMVTFLSFAPKIVFADTSCTCHCKIQAAGSVGSPASSLADCGYICGNASKVDSCPLVTPTSPTATPSSPQPPVADGTSAASPSCPSKPSAGSAPAKTSATPCICFCASDKGTASQGQMTVAECKTACQKTTDKKMVTCSYNGEDTPDHNQFCFTQAQCGALMGFDANGDPIAQPGIFQTGASQAHDCPAPLSYCYANKGTPFKLAFPFDPKKPTVIDLGDYINQAYAWMIGAGMTISIVMVMIGGLQYVLAAGSGSVEKGKKRIRNGIVGFILLLCVNLILQTVNPNMTILEVPRIPLVKQIGMPTVSCEQAAIAKGKDGKALYTLCPAATGKAVDGMYKGSEQCGTPDAQLSAGAGQTGVASGSSCSWTSCPNFGQFCLNKKCVTCEGANESDSPVKPSVSICNQLSPPVPTKPGSDTLVCQWQKEVSTGAAIAGALAPAPIAAVTKSLNTSGKCILINVTKDAANAATWQGQHDSSGTFGAGGKM